LDVADDILNHGCHMSGVAFWNPKQDGQCAGIERTSFELDVVAAARYKHEVTVH
jgi:phenol 2-monooxygenase